MNSPFSVQFQSQMISLLGDIIKVLSQKINFRFCTKSKRLK